MTTRTYNSQTSVLHSLDPWGPPCLESGHCNIVPSRAVLALYIYDVGSPHRAYPLYLDLYLCLCLCLYLYLSPISCLPTSSSSMGSHISWTYSFPTTCLCIFTTSEASYQSTLLTWLLHHKIPPRLDTNIQSQCATLPRTITSTPHVTTRAHTSSEPRSTATGSMCVPRPPTRGTSSSQERVPCVACEPTAVAILSHTRKRTDLNSNETTNQ